MPTLDWLTRNQDLQTADRVPYRLLEEVPDLSCTNRDPATENMLVHGNNLDALRALLPIYAGQVKCICIDPPYDTRSAFEHYDDTLEHTQWRAMMLPRPQLLREFLREDGSLWVTIDDNKAPCLKVLRLIPGKDIRSQTQHALQNLDHPYRRALWGHWGDRVQVYDMADFTRIAPQTLAQNLVLFVTTRQALQVKDTEGGRLRQQLQTLKATSVPSLRRPR